MRFANIFLTLLLIVTFSKAFCVGKMMGSDTTKHIVKAHHRKHFNWPKIHYPAPANKVYYQDCVFTHRYTAAQRLTRYPFNKAVKILAISYDGTPEPNVDIVIGPDTGKHEKRKSHDLIFHHGVLDTSNLFEIKVLSRVQINRLTNIMANTRDRISNDYLPVNLPHACFNPRNAFIFIDKNGKAFDYLEICFECNQIESKSDKIYFSSGCTQILDLVKKYLISVGIKFGTTTTDTAGFN